jgi:hypothetical protein
LLPRGVLALVVQVGIQEAREPALREAANVVRPCDELDPLGLNLSEARTPVARSLRVLRYLREEGRTGDREEVAPRAPDARRDPAPAQAGLVG